MAIITVDNQMSWLAHNMMIDKLASSAENQTLSGPLVDQIISITQNMIGLGAPVEIDDMGFNQSHYGSPVVHAVASYPFGS